MSDRDAIIKAQDLVEQLKQRGVKTVRILAVDFDGTLTRTNSYPELAAFRPLVINVLKGFQASGGKVLLFTCREGATLQDALDALGQENFRPDFVNEQTSKNLVGHRKPYYDLLIDDRALGCPLDWFVIGIALAELKPIPKGAGKDA